MRARFLVGACLGLGLGSGVQAGEPETWSALHDARLLEALDGDTEGALAIYESVLDGLEPSAPLWDQTILSIAKVRMRMGDLSGAREELVRIIDRPAVKMEARALLVRTEMLQQPVQSLPYVDPIAVGQSRWIRGWTRGEIDDLHYVTEPESCLAWDLQVVQSQTDFIVLSLGPLSTMPHRLEITARSREFLSGIIVVMEDHDGGQWRSEILDLPPGDWSELQIEISELVRLSGDREVPDATRLRAIIIQDMTGQVSALQGSNRIEIRDTLIY